MNIVIKKAKIKSSLFLYYECEHKDGIVKNDSKINCDAPIHDDLRNAFRGLIPHLVALCELCPDKDLLHSAIQRPESYVEDREHSASEEFFKYDVDEVIIDVKKGNVVSILGSKTLTSLEDLGLVAPSIDLDSSHYEYLPELNKAVDNLRKEVLAYIEGKFGTGRQMEMFGEEQEEEHEEKASTMKVIKPKKSKKNNEAFAE